ncbi:hypothetical protein QWY16_14985 [Planococcus shenhongbingii]|uniref:hypothetical protein n=1 Tax=Planococcus shenhongbingii TaxID=3058398 RepID=UPI00261CB9C7|nr:hypothetical protein [Planococcus sp. N016]WKA57791.1 hypothetical protein QWY16_14985 [Planococcus sp. N016]
MFELVNSEEQQKIFNGIWEEVWKEKGYELEYSSETIAQLLLKVQNQYVATIEFKKLSSSTICSTFDFKAFPFIEKNFDHGVEIDKISIAKEYRGFEVLNAIISAMGHFAKDTGLLYYVALIEPRFYLTLRKHYKINVEKLGPPFFYKGDTVVPIFFTSEEIQKNKNQYSRFLEKVQL